MATKKQTAFTARAPSLEELDAANARAMVDSHQDDDSSELFGINDLCQAFSITPRTLRFYEDKQLLSPRRINNARIYTRRDRARLALILRAKAIGSTLKEIKQYLDLYGNHGEGRLQQLNFVMERTASTISDLERKRSQIDETLAELRFINEGCRRQLEEKRRQKMAK